MLFDITFIADWQKIGVHRQQLTDLNNARENEGRIYDYKVGQKVLVRKEGNSANLSPYGIESLGSLRQSIQMEQS
jgi:hypothetical protein